MDIYGLIGYPLGHSFSISYFNEKFQNENINARYVNFEIPNIEDLREVLDSNPDLKQRHHPLQAEGHPLSRRGKPGGTCYRSRQRDSHHSKR